jgi:two-component system, OmpR family, response regulator
MRYRSWPHLVDAHSRGKLPAPSKVMSSEGAFSLLPRPSNRHYVLVRCCWKRHSAPTRKSTRQWRDFALRLLVIEDDPDLNRQLATALTDAGYVVDRAFDGEEGHFLGESEPYDAVILDIGLPKMDGISVLEAWRRAGRAMPVLMLTARDRWSDKVQGFDAGADDYVAKPFHLEEVLARIRALLRRSAGHAKSELNCGPVRLDTRTGRVTVDGNPVKLTSHEYRLLSYLMHHSGRVVSRSELVEHLYDQDFDRDSNTIEVFVGRIRKKLGVDVIQTVRGLGYLLTPPGDAS